MRTQNGILADIVVASGGTVTLPATRNSLLADWLLAASGGYPYPNSWLNGDGTINCAGIIYCDQPIICGV